MAEIGFIHRATLQTNASNIVRPSEDEITLQNVWASLLRIEDSLSRLLGRVGQAPSLTMKRMWNQQLQARNSLKRLRSETFAVKRSNLTSMEYESCGSATKHRTANEIDIVKLCVCGPAHLQSNGSFELVMPASRETTSWMPRVSHKFFESHPHWRHVIGILALHCGLPHLTEETLMLDFKQLQKSQLMPWIRRIREFRFKARNGQKKNNFILPTTRTNGSLSLNRRIAAVDGTLDGYRVTYRHVDKNLRKFSSWLEGLASQAYVFPFFKMNQDSIEENFKYFAALQQLFGTQF